MARVSTRREVPRPAPRELQLPLMYLAPQRSLRAGRAEADTPGRFEELRTRLDPLGVGIKVIYAYHDPAKNRFIGSFVLDVTDSHLGANQLATLVATLPGLQTVELGPVGRGLAAVETDLLTVDGTPVAVFGRTIIGGAFRRLADALGDRGPATLFEAGRAAGREAASGVPALVQQLGAQLRPELIRERFRDLEVFGWGDLVSLRLADDLSGEVVLSGDFEAAVWNGQAATSQCHWIRGFLAGALSTLAGREFTVEEPECQARGDQFCRMTLHPSPSTSSV